MAFAKTNPAVTQTKVIEISPATITLTLSQKEAKFLHAVLGKTNGDTFYSLYKSLDDLIPENEQFPRFTGLPSIDVIGFLED